MEEVFTDVVVVGAGFSGISVAAALSSQKLKDFVVLEQGDRCGAFWGNGHDSLAMHTPYHGVPFDGNLDRKYSMFKTKGEVSAYLTDYAKLYELEDKLSFNTEVLSIVNDKTCDKKERSENGTVMNNSVDENSYIWTVTTPKGVIHAKSVAVCSGLCAKPHVPVLPKQSAFTGEIVHSWGIRSCRAFAGKKVLVVGSGNSADELVLDCIANKTESVELLVSSPRYFLPKSTLKTYYEGMLGLSWLLGLGHVAEQVHELHRTCPHPSDAWFKVQQGDENMVRNWLSTDLTKYGIETPPPLAQGESFQSRRAVIDVGVIELIKRGDVSVVSGMIKACCPGGVEVKMKTAKEAPPVIEQHPCDVIILATGFCHSLDKFIPNFDKYCFDPAVGTSKLVSGSMSLDEQEGTRSKYPLRQRVPTVVPTEAGGSTCSRSRLEPSLYFVGFDHRVATTTLGHQGWDTGIAICKDLRRYDARHVPIGLQDVGQQKSVDDLNTFTYAAGGLLVGCVSYGLWRKLFRK